MAKSIGARVFGSETEALRKKMKAKRAISKTVNKVRAGAVRGAAKVINKVTGSTGGVYKLTSARRAALEKARKASARARATASGAVRGVTAAARTARMTSTPQSDLVKKSFSSNFKRGYDASMARSSTRSPRRRGGM